MGRNLPRVRNPLHHAVAAPGAVTLYLLVYDITDARGLQKTGRWMEQFGYLRWQKSVWLGARHPKQIPALYRKLETLFALPEMAGSQIAWCKMHTAHLGKLGYLGQAPDHTIALACGKIKLWYLE